MLAATQRKKVLLTLLLGSTWLVSLAYGVRSLFSYETTPGKTGKSPQSWPAASQISRAADQHTLVMFAHPHCPCTRASMGELANIMARSQGKLRSYVLLLKPESTAADWEDTDLRRAAEAIPGVTVIIDGAGVEARRFGAGTSGHTILFDPSGRQVFTGGITASRGHAGGNAGEDSILALVDGTKPATGSTMVFGCGLTSENTDQVP